MKDKYEAIPFLRVNGMLNKSIISSKISACAVQHTSFIIYNVVYSNIPNIWLITFFKGAYNKYYKE